MNMELQLQVQEYDNVFTLLYNNNCLDTVIEYLLMMLSANIANKNTLSFYNKAKFSDLVELLLTNKDNYYLITNVLNNLNLREKLHFLTMDNDIYKRLYEHNEITLDKNWISLKQYLFDRSIHIKNLTSLYTFAEYYKYFDNDYFIKVNINILSLLNIKKIIDHDINSVYVNTVKLIDNDNLLLHFNSYANNFENIISEKIANINNYFTLNYVKNPLSISFNNLYNNPFQINRYVSNTIAESLIADKILGAVCLNNFNLHILVNNNPINLSISNKNINELNICVTSTGDNFINSLNTILLNNKINILNFKLYTNIMPNKKICLENVKKFKILDIDEW